MSYFCAKILKKNGMRKLFNYKIIKSVRFCGFTVRGVIAGIADIAGIEAIDTI